jgi:hypothetical protein
MKKKRLATEIRAPILEIKFHSAKADGYSAILRGIPASPKKC